MKRILDRLFFFLLFGWLVVPSRRHHGRTRNAPVEPPREPVSAPVGPAFWEGCTYLHDLQRWYAELELLAAHTAALSGVYVWGDEHYESLRKNLAEMSQEVLRRLPLYASDLAEVESGTWREPSLPEYLASAIRDDLYRLESLQDYVSRDFLLSAEGEPKLAPDPFDS